jgi:tyrosyl-tRNA synthetase
MKVFDDLVGRGLVKQVTDAEKVSQLLEGENPCTFYLGIDPTASSLHIGHLLPIITAKRLINAGHQAFILIGDATAKIGDPSGKSSSRPILSDNDIFDNTQSIEKQLRTLMPGGERAGIWLKSNSCWFRHTNFFEFVHDIGSHFSVNNMLRADCFKSRLGQGLSFLEFSYMLMQAFDFFELNKFFGCNLQIGGDDQWSNMLAGTDLIHKKTGQEAFALTLPLLVNADGTKMGKTEKGAIWLENTRTSFFDFFQFWRNLPDTEVIKCFQQLTFISLEEIASLPFSTIKEINSTKKKLAFELTKIVHGEEVAQKTLKRVEDLFDSQDVSNLEPVQIKDGEHILDVLVRCTLAKSRTEGRNLIIGHGITINNEVLTDPTTILSRLQFKDPLILCKGKKHFRLLHFIKESNE